MVAQSMIIGEQRFEISPRMLNQVQLLRLGSQDCLKAWFKQFLQAVVFCQRTTQPVISWSSQRKRVPLKMDCLLCRGFYSHSRLDCSFCWYVTQQTVEQILWLSEELLYWQTFREIMYLLVAGFFFFGIVLSCTFDSLVFGFICLT